MEDSKWNEPLPVDVLSYPRGPNNGENRPVDLDTRMLPSPLTPEMGIKEGPVDVLSDPGGLGNSENQPLHFTILDPKAPSHTGKSVSSVATLAIWWAKYLEISE